MAGPRIDVILLGMETKGTRVVGVRGYSFGSIVALGAALSTGCNAGDATTGGPEDEMGPICASCTAGGQTTDFGTVDPCSNNAEGEAIDLATAGELGFTNLDQFEREFEASFRWIPQETTNGGPATGYDPSTRVRGRTTLESIKHVPAASDVCDDTLRVTLELEFATEDRALEIAGPVHAWVRRGESLAAEGTLDLAHASGTLHLAPSDWSWVARGAVPIFLAYWPDRVRGSLALALAAEREPGDFPPPPHSYFPLTAQFPDDWCDYTSLPFAPDEPGATPSGLSASELRAELQALIGDDPLPGSWGDGAAVSAETTFGEPRNVCVGPSALGYEMPLVVTSSDARIHVDELARAWTIFDAEGNIETSLVEYYGSETLPKATFADRSGITGVDFGDVKAAFWRTEMYLARYDEPVPRGEVVVEGVDVDGALTGVTNAVIGPIARFDWSK
jgi:hypothetical protein